MPNSPRLFNTDTSDSNRAWLPNFWSPMAVLWQLLFGFLASLIGFLLVEGLVGFRIGALGSYTMAVTWVILLSALQLGAVRRVQAQLPDWALVLLCVACVTLATLLVSSVTTWVRFKMGMPEQTSVWVCVIVAQILALVVLRFLYVHHQLSQHEQRLLKAQYDALQARIQPHFLFNTLNSIAELICVRPQDAENAVLDLADLMRGSVRAADSVSTLGQELRLCEKYLAIEKLRMGERLQWHFELMPAAKNVVMPLLVIQPLLENAILHGVALIPEGGTIQLAARVENNTLILSVANPMPSTQRDAHRGNAVGLANLQARLNVLYPDAVKYQVDCASECYIVRIEVMLGT